ncbi:HNH endonuclease [Streptomyces sp. O3]
MRKLGSARRRARKEQVARRFGMRCAYCRVPLGSLRDATLDHVVPLKLWRSWSGTSLVLACEPCNGAKADWLPLSMALLLVFAYGTGQAVTSVRGLAGERVHGSVHDRSAGGIGERSGGRVGGGPVDSYGVDWRLLARLAHTHQPVFEATWRPDPVAVPAAARSGCELRKSSAHRHPHGGVHHAAGRPGCLRSARLVRECSRPTGSAVPA